MKIIDTESRANKKYSRGKKKHQKKQNVKTKAKTVLKLIVTFPSNDSCKRFDHTAYEGFKVSSTPHLDESDRDADVAKRIVLDNAGDRWWCIEVGGFNGSSYGELWGRGAGGGARSTSKPSWRNPLPNTPACENGYRGTPISNGCF